MAYQVLARKYRPQRFADVAGQDHVTRTLQNALEQGRIAHGYIFSGHRGIGKTTIARILASALNCRNMIGSPERPTPEPCGVCDSCIEIRQGNAVDVIEIDAATNRGIDEIRELRDAARYRPARDKYKIYILDEAHQITDAAFNALLKTLEEPPDHIVFMMATTEPENIPQTIRSRCQHFSFHAVKLEDILGELRGISEREDVLADDATLALLAEAGDGSMRDALSIMDQAIASAPTVDGKPQLSASEVRDLMGTVPNAVFEQVLEQVSAGNSAEVITTVGKLLDAGNSPAQIARQFVKYLRNCVVAKIAGLTPEKSDTELLQISPDERRRAARSATLFTEEELTRFLQVMLRTFDDLGFRQEQRLHLEVGLLKLVHLQRLLPLESFLSQLPKPGASSTSAAPRAATPATSAPPVAHSPAPSSNPPSPRTPEAPPSTAPAQTAAPSFSPFQADRARKSMGDDTAPIAASPSPFSEPSAPPANSSAPMPVGSVTSSQPDTAGALALAPEPVKPAPRPSNVSALAEPGASVPTDASTGIDIKLPPKERAVTAILPAPASVSREPGPTSTPAAAPSDSSDLAPLQTAVVEALFAAKSHNSAAEQLEETTWTIADGELRVQTSLSKQLLGTIFRPDVETIMKSALRANGAGGLKIVFLPGAPTSSQPKQAKAPRSGSVQAKAMDHPTVQAAQKLFNAEVTTVFDLRRD